ncbi:hypothetical protein LB503_012764 [Fusarium chuoi]|nr:hypothetical protein LB503_012764 [Fusarium chuoi]
MRMIKPSWLSHSGEQKDFEVYSCHVSPDGKRLATAGGDGHVRVWSTESIYNADTPNHHLGTIHSVRFSPNGRYLASGADDKIICVYHLDKGPPAATFGTNEPPPVENWKTYKRLIGHDNDVQDLAWSYDSSILVSVVVWSGHTFEKLKTLPAHQSHVKGITFDPANKFFATASDDRTIKIFRFTSPAPNATQHDMVNNFVLETTISTPFKTANAVNGPVSSVAIIERTRWDSEINLIGHEAPTEVCMFSPRLFHTSKPDASAADGAATSLVTVIASAGQDKTLIVCQDLAGKSISDLAWTPDGQTIFASSLDGSIVVVNFEEGELGWVAQPEENVKALQKYGASRKGMGIAEDVDGLILENQKSRMGALMGDFSESTKESTPIANGPKPNGTSAKPSTNGQAEPENEPEKQPEETADKTAERVKELKSRVTIGKDGKKRVAPLRYQQKGRSYLGRVASQRCRSSNSDETLLGRGLRRWICAYLDFGWKKTSRPYHT